MGNSFSAQSSLALSFCMSVTLSPALFLHETPITLLDAPSPRLSVLCSKSKSCTEKRAEQRRAFFCLHEKIQIFSISWIDWALWKVHKVHVVLSFSVALYSSRFAWFKFKFRPVILSRSSVQTLKKKGDQVAQDWMAGGRGFSALTESTVKGVSCTWPDLITMKLWAISGCTSHKIKSSTDSKRETKYKHLSYKRALKRDGESLLTK